AYPDTSYLTGGINSPAETIIFFVAPDSSTARADDYALFEQVNGGPPALVSRNIVGSPTSVYFEYYRLTRVAGALTLDSLPAATDEYGGEKDVVQYVIWRKRITDVTWGTPYLSLPAGSPTYVYDDAVVTSGLTYQYQLAAADCTPSSSPTTTSAPVTIP